MVDTRTLQLRLKALGFDPGPIDNIHGPDTISAVQAFQATRGQKADGVARPETMAALGLQPSAVAGQVVTLSSDGVDLVKAWEGVEDGDKRTVELDPYVCPAGVVTIGWGHAVKTAAGGLIRVRPHGTMTVEAGLELARQRVRELFGTPAITRDQAKALLSMDLNEFAAGVVARLQKAGVRANQAEFDALVSLAFNIGLGNFQGSSVLRFHAAGKRIGPAPLDYAALMARSRAGAAPADMAEAFGAWSRGGGVWLLGLFRRRMCEAMVYRGDPLAHVLPTAQSLRRAA